MRSEDRERLTHVSHLTSGSRLRRRRFGGRWRAAETAPPAAASSPSLRRSALCISSYSSVPLREGITVGEEVHDTR